MHSQTLLNEHPGPEKVSAYHVHAALNFCEIILANHQFLYIFAGTNYMQVTCETTCSNTCIKHSNPVLSFTLSQLQYIVLLCGIIDALLNGVYVPLDDSLQAVNFCFGMFCFFVLNTWQQQDSTLSL